MLTKDKMDQLYKKAELQAEIEAKKEGFQDPVMVFHGIAGWDDNSMNFKFTILGDYEMRHFYSYVTYKELSNI